MQTVHTVYRSTLVAAALALGCLGATSAAQADEHGWHDRGGDRPSHGWRDHDGDRGWYGHDRGWHDQGWHRGWEPRYRAAVPAWRYGDRYVRYADDDDRYCPPTVVYRAPRYDRGPDGDLSLVIRVPF
jgi:Ni/Co efflux regulator RcnB